MMLNHDGLGQIAHTSLLVDTFEFARPQRDRTDGRPSKMAAAAVVSSAAEGPPPPSCAVSPPSGFSRRRTICPHGSAEVVFSPSFSDGLFLLRFKLATLPLALEPVDLDGPILVTGLRTRLFKRKPNKYKSNDATGKNYQSNGAANEQ